MDTQIAHRDVFAGGGGCGALLRAIDWSQHPLGEPERWPLELRTVAQIVLGARQPMFLLWGPERHIIYNDLCGEMYGPFHPRALAKPFAETLRELWSQVAPYVNRAYEGVSAAASDVEFMVTRHGYPETVNVSFSYTPVRMANGVVAGMFCAFNETTGRVALQRQREREQGRLRSIFETALGAVAVTSGPQHLITYTNADFEAISGYRQAAGKRAVDAFPDIHGQGFFELLDHVYATRAAMVNRAMPARLQRTADDAPDERVIDILCHPIATPGGAVEGLFVQILDVTDSHLLSKELAHRLKNQLTVVQAIVNQSLRGARDIDSARQILSARINTLARAHEAAMASDQSGAHIENVISNAIGWHDRARLRISGPHTPIAARPALSLALIMHELLTNALKYGALSQPEGEVAVNWSVSEANGALFELVWQESGGPPVAEPATRGAGSRLIMSGLSGAPSLRVTLDFRPEGVRFAISGDVAALTAS